MVITVYIPCRGANWEVSLPSLLTHKQTCSFTGLDAGILCPMAVMFVFCSGGLSIGPNQQMSPVLARA